MLLKTEWTADARGRTKFNCMHCSALIVRMLCGCENVPQAVFRTLSFVCHHKLRSKIFFILFSQPAKNCVLLRIFVGAPLRQDSIVSYPFFCVNYFLFFFSVIHLFRVLLYAWAFICRNVCWRFCCRHHLHRSLSAFTLLGLCRAY